MINKLALTFAAALTATTAHANAPIGDVFVIALENQNAAVQGPSARPDLNPIYGDTAAAPYINSLITPGNPNAVNTAYASAYHNIINGASDLHPSEPNYIYQVSGLIPKITDADPSVANGNLYPAGTTNLGTSLTNAGKSWKAYQEGIDSTGGNNPGAVPTNTIAPQNQWTEPNAGFAGTSLAYTNPYNGSHQYNYAPKHNPFVFFAGDNNPANYAPLQQLSTDLTNNTVANFNWITPDQYNDAHSQLTGGFTYNGQHFTGDQANIAQADNFLSILVPQIEASQAFKNNGLIVLWTDEDEGDTPATNANYTNLEILIGHDTKGNAFTDFVPMNHNTDLQSYLDIFSLDKAGYPGAITGSNTFGSLLKTGSILPEPGTWAMMIVGLGAVGVTMRRRKFVLAA